jgi:hypothetical protein
MSRPGEWARRLTTVAAALAVAATIGVGVSAIAPLDVELPEAAASPGDVAPLHGQVAALHGVPTLIEDGPIQREFSGGAALDDEPRVRAWLVALADQAGIG